MFGARQAHHCCLQLPDGVTAFQAYIFKASPMVWTLGQLLKILQFVLHIMPSLIVGPVVEADFDRMLLYTDEAGGSLAAPIMFDSWPATEPTDTARRNAWSMEQQRWQFHNDPTVRFMKVEDQASGEIVSLARWHRYNDGYPQENTYTEVDVFAPQGTAPKFPEGFNGRIHAGVLEVACRNRAGYVKPGLCWSEFSRPRSR